VIGRDLEPSAMTGAKASGELIQFNASPSPLWQASAFGKRKLRATGVAKDRWTTQDIERLAAPVPRYTSYPTAPHFSPAVGAAQYRDWLEALPDHASLSLYAHLPFCDTLCWFCGCSTKITRQYAPVATYLEALLAEVALISCLVPASARATHLHWGGGSPTILTARDILRLADALRSAFRVSADAAFAVEVDPRGMDHERIDALAAAGLTRVSIGVQDFDPAVQRAINRIQSVAETAQVIERFRQHGVPSLNIDAIYGLPGQGERELLRTLADVVRMEPDRIALFGYAHVPWMKKHQSMIDETTLAGVVDRHRHAELAADYLVSEGYERVGIDHFAKPHDSLAMAARAGSLVRNFQGYTVDRADALIGLGASSIGRLPGGYVQNVTGIGNYQRCISAGELAAERGIAISPDDSMRAFVIERLMCDLSFDAILIEAAYGAAARPVLAQAQRLVHSRHDGLVEPTERGFRITEQGRPFTRRVAAAFDSYLANGTARHSAAV
jgi:oxygen-independent coproporphyrinogen-3 oxidase